MARQGYMPWWSPRGGTGQRKRFSLPSPPTKQHKLVLHMGTEWLAHVHSSSASTKVMDMETFISMCFDERA